MSLKICNLGNIEPTDHKPIILLFSFKYRINQSYNKVVNMQNQLLKFLRLLTCFNQRPFHIVTLILQWKLSSNFIRYTGNKGKVSTIIPNNNTNNYSIIIVITTSNNSLTNTKLKTFHSMSVFNVRAYLNISSQKQRFGIFFSKTK